MAGALERYVEIVVSFSGRLKDLVPVLKDFSSLLQSNLDNLPAVFEALDPTTHSLGWLFAACAGISCDIPSPSLAQMCQFLRLCPPEAAQAAPDIFVQVSRQVKERAIRTGMPKTAILPLRSALQKMQPSPEDLTPLHGDLFQVCILAKCYHAAVEILNLPITNVAPDLTGSTPRDFLLYAYYGGLIRIGRKQYGDAVNLLLLAVTAPSSVASAISIAAYQKYVLLSLMHGAADAALPRSTPAPVSRQIKSECTPYQEFLQAYNRRSVSELESVAQSHAHVFQGHGNLGLVNLCVESLRFKNAGRLTHTHLTMSLQGIADACNLASRAAAESQILHMVEKGDIFASINQRDGMVSFNEDPEDYKSSSLTDALAQHIEGSIALQSKLKESNDIICGDRTYLMRVALKDKGMSRHTADSDEFPVAPMYN
mmetsp:Transcript_25550/g.71462  ORF Transcript_25550/g.71462 Transcript_25550/m.71462 type:complete len:427 (+) Transcript_25550:308-1588(+)|eukprot:CAMPEP_0117668842 /NCGR_PEP_ID=MMETSP0804-20121206/11782_1 /TAXON_ID=1074897 /ORGANISM="Tetraselmis astigmatica, Strain CCMP880" /LENGTH=426 /DNA_ID=CAMNT_0005476795 /DNA_START=216 /DNA_END=1496 /DNA_ORIENTATION=-